MVKGKTSDTVPSISCDTNTGITTSDDVTNTIVDNSNDTSNKNKITTSSTENSVKADNNITIRQQRNQQHKQDDDDDDVVGVAAVIKTAQSELASLGRVSHKLALVDTTQKLNQVLDKLLPRLLKRMGDNNRLKNDIIIRMQKQQNPNQPSSTSSWSSSLSLLLKLYEQFHTKLVEILSHTIKRVRHDKECHLPCLDILKSLFIKAAATTRTTTTTASSLLSSSTSVSSDDEDLLWNYENDPLLINLSLLFLQIGIGRLDIKELAQLLPFLLLCQKVVYYNGTTSSTASKNMTIDHTSTYFYETISSPTKKSIGYQFAHLLLQCIDGLVHTTNQQHILQKQKQQQKQQQDTNSSNVHEPGMTASILLTCIEEARRICRTDPMVASVVYDLFLDVLLFQHPSTTTTTTRTISTSTSTTATMSISGGGAIPPKGLSQYGHERLLSFFTTSSSSLSSDTSLSSPSNGGSTQQRPNNNHNVHDTITIKPMIINQFKDSIITFISPRLRYGLFLSSSTLSPSTSQKKSTSPPGTDTDASSTRPLHTATASSTAIDPAGISDNGFTNNTTTTTTAMTIGSMNAWEPVGVARTVALLVLASALDDGSGGSSFSNNNQTTTTLKDISDRATMDLKIHLDSYRNSSSSSSTNNGSTTITTTSNSDNKNDVTSINTTAQALGGSSLAIVPLATSLVGLCIGQSHAESIMLRIFSKQFYNKYNNYNNNISPLAFVSPNNTCRTSASTGNISQQIVLSTKRLPLSESVSAVVLSFVRNKILDEYPHVFEEQRQQQQQQQQLQQQQQHLRNMTTNANDDWCNNDDCMDRDDDEIGVAVSVGDTDCKDSITNNGSMAVQLFSSISVHAASKVLLAPSSSGISMGLSMGRAKSYLAASQLLNSLTIRLSLHYDAISSTAGFSTMVEGNNTNSSNSDNEKNTVQLLHAIEQLLAESLSIACTVLSPILTKYPAGINNNNNDTNSSTLKDGDGSISIRDNCYGVICTLARSQFAMHCMGYMFARGQVQSQEQRLQQEQQDQNKQNESDSGAITSVVGVCQHQHQHQHKQELKVSIETAALLFGCASNEVDRLRPRATAALDALLGAYIRVYTPASPVSSSTAIMRAQSNPLHQSQAQPLAEVVSSNPWQTNAVLDVLMTPVEEDSKREVETTYSTIRADRVGLGKALVPLIWSAAQPYRLKASRVAAARWASDILKQLDLTKACHILCFLSGDIDETASSIAKDGLKIQTLTIGSTTHDDATFLVHLTGRISAFSNNNVTILPDFGEFVKVLYPETLASTTTSALFKKFPTYNNFSMQGKAATLQFTLSCLMNDLYGGDDRHVGMYVSALQETMTYFCSSMTRGSVLNDSTGGRSSSSSTSSLDLLDECSLCLLTVLSSSHYARTLVASARNGSFGLAEMKDLCINATSSRARRYLACTCQCLFNDVTLWLPSTEKITEDTFSQWITNSQIDRTLAECAETLSKLGFSVSSSSLGPYHGCAYLGSHAAKVYIHQSIRSISTSVVEDVRIRQCWDHVSKIIDALGKNLSHAEEILGNACSDGLGIAYSCNELDSPILNQRMYKCTTSALTSIASALKRFSQGDNANSSRAIKVVRASGFCLAASTSGSGIVDLDETGQTINLGPTRLHCVDSLFDVLGSEAFRKEEEISITVGEALADYADAISPTRAVWSSDNVEWPPDSSVQEFEKCLPPHEQVLYILLRKCFTANSPHKKISCAPALLAIVVRGTRKVHSDKSHANRALIQSLLKHMDEIQETFISLLSYPKSKQFARESCCLGLAACRGLLQASEQRANSDVDSHQRLLRAFGQTTNFGGSAMIETQAQAAARRAAEAAASSVSNSAGSQIMEPFGEETQEVGGAAGLGEAALGAYREMAAASVSLGREDVLYALLVLSVSHAYWHTETGRERYSAASLLGEDSANGSSGSAQEFRIALKPHLGRLLPRILRACHDPNKQTRDQMNSLWLGLTGGGADGRAAISNNLLTTVDTLLDDAISKFWRARVGASGALSEVITGREWNELGGGGPVLSDDDMYDNKSQSAGTRLLRLWRVAMRALDDVRAPVRDKGETLARAVRSLTIRLCDPSSLDKAKGTKRGRDESAQIEKDAIAAAATSLRWLIKHGLNQTCAEATGISISTLVEVVGIVKPKILEPILPELLRSLLLAMSSLEPAALNYLQLRTTDQDMATGLERARLQLAQSGPLAVGVSKCIELLPFVGLETQRMVAPELDTALRMASGFATRVAVADAVSALCSTCPNVFRFSGVSSANPSVRLLRAFYFASEREHGSGSMDKLVHALGHLAALCPGGSVRSLARRACDRYRQSIGNNDDPAARKAAAATLRAIAVRASNQFSDGGKNDIWGRYVMPAAYIGKKDPDTKISGLWSDVWEEGGSATNLLADSTGPRFGTTLEENLLPFIVDECVHALEDVSWDRRVAGGSALSDLCDIGVLSPLRINLNTMLNANTSSAMLRSKNRAESSHKALNAILSLLAKPRLWNGKSSLVTTVAKIATKWLTTGEADIANEELIMLGWDNQDRLCPWSPILLAPGEYSGDLITGDNFFAHDSSPESVDSISKLEATDKPADKIPDGDVIDFEELECGLDDEAQMGDGAAENAIVANTAIKVVTITGLCKFLINQAFPSSIKQSQNIVVDELLPYRTACLRAFRDILNSLPENTLRQRVEIFKMTFPSLMDVCNNEIESNSENKEVPVLIAGAIECICSCFWKGIGSGNANDMSGDLKPEDLINKIKDCGGKNQSAWTVREASSLCISHFVKLCHLNVIRQPAIISTMVNASTFHLTDARFWRVRYAGLKILDSLTTRAGIGYHSASTNHLILEALLPHKETIQNLCRKMLGDQESSVTALSSAILASISLWP